MFRMSTPMAVGAAWAAALVVAEPAAAQASEDFWGAPRMWSDVEVWSDRQKPRMFDVVGEFPACSSTVMTTSGDRIKTNKLSSAGLVVDQNVEIKAIQLPQDSLKIRIQRGQSLTFRGAPFAGAVPPAVKSTASLPCEAQTTTTTTTTNLAMEGAKAYPYTAGMSDADLEALTKKCLARFTAAGCLHLSDVLDQRASTAASSSGSKKDSAVGTVLITLLVVLVVIVIVSVFGVIYVVRSRAAKAAAATKSNVSFENPMYDATAFQKVTHRSGHPSTAGVMAQSQSTQSDSGGYMDVSPNNGGYMDVPPNGGGYMSTGSPEYKENPVYIEPEATEGDESGGYMDVAPNEDPDDEFPEDV